MTIVYPSWEIAVERNRSGINIINVAPNGTTQGSATEINADYETTVVTCVGNITDRAIKISASASVGDRIEVYNNSSDQTSLSVFPAAGEKIGSTPSNTPVSVTFNKGVALRKTASGTWHSAGHA